MFPSIMGGVLLIILGFSGAPCPLVQFSPVNSRVTPTPPSSQVPWVGGHMPGGARHTAVRR